MTEDSLQPEEHDKHAPHARCEFTNRKTRVSFPPLTMVILPADTAGSLIKTNAPDCSNMRSTLRRSDSLCENSFHQLPMHVRQSITPALKPVRQSFVINAQQVQDRCVQVVDVQSISRNVVSELIRAAVH